MGQRTQIIELIFPKAGMEPMKMAKKLDGQEENKQLPGACPLKNYENGMMHMQMMMKLM